MEKRGFPRFLICQSASVRAHVFMVVYALSLGLMLPLLIDCLYFIF